MKTSKDRKLSPWARDRRRPPPSQRFATHLDPPPGTVSVFRVVGYGDRQGFHTFGVYLDDKAACLKADEVFQDRRYAALAIRVEHRAAIRLSSGKYHIINIPSVTITDLTHESATSPRGSAADQCDAASASEEHLRSV